MGKVGKMTPGSAPGMSGQRDGYLILPPGKSGSYGFSAAKRRIRHGDGMPDDQPTILTNAAISNMAVSNMAVSNAAISSTAVSGVTVSDVTVSDAAVGGAAVSNTAGAPGAMPSQASGPPPCSRWQNFRAGLRHAFALRSPLGPLNREDHALLSKLADAVVRRRMAAPAILFLGSLRPLGYMGSQAMVFLRPFATLLFKPSDYERLAAILERREGMDALLNAIEAACPESRRETS